MDCRHAQAMQFPDPAPAVRLVDDSTEGLEQLAIGTGQHLPLPQPVAEGLGLLERSHEGLPADMPSLPPLPRTAQHVPKGRLAGVGFVASIIHQGHVETGDPARRGSRGPATSRGKRLHRAAEGQVPGGPDLPHRRSLRRDSGPAASSADARNRGASGCDAGTIHAESGPWHQPSPRRNRPFAARLVHGRPRQPAMRLTVGRPCPRARCRPGRPARHNPPLVPGSFQEAREIAQRAESLTRIWDDGDPPVMPRRVSQYLRGGVAAAVVADKQRPLGMRLGQDALQKPGQVRFALVGGQNDCEARGEWIHEVSQFTEGAEACQAIRRAAGGGRPKMILTRIASAGRLPHPHLRFGFVSERPPTSIRAAGRLQSPHI